MITDALLKEMNEAYHQLEWKHAEIAHSLFHRIFNIESGWYNGHYAKAADDTWQRQSYPIPVISVKGYCDVEISFEQLSVTTKLKRAKALTYSYDRIKNYDFEVYGVENYLCNFYHKGQTIAELKNNIAQSDEREIGFSFVFPFNIDGKDMFEFVKLLRREGFYY